MWCNATELRPTRDQRFPTRETVDVAAQSDRCVDMSPCVDGISSFAFWHFLDEEAALCQTATDGTVVCQLPVTSMMRTNNSMQRTVRPTVAYSAQTVIDAQTARVKKSITIFFNGEWVTRYTKHESVTRYRQMLVKMCKNFIVTVSRC
jgi:hypothetical protein